jgi:hypothetical protein
MESGRLRREFDPLNEHGISFVPEAVIRGMIRMSTPLALRRMGLYSPRID